GLATAADALTVLVLAAEAVALCGDAGCADDVYGELLPYAGWNVVMSRGWASFGPVSRYLGLCAAAAGRGDLAPRPLEDAVAENERLGTPVWRDERIGLRPAGR